MEEDKIKEIASHYQAILELLGEDPKREGLDKTPMRAAKAMWYITQGYRLDPESTIKEAVFEHAGSKIISVKNIEFYTMCEHHILPFFGHVSIAYVPKGKMIGLSKLARLVNVYARRLQVQERLTSQICNALFTILPAEGVMVKVEADHLCMKMRGVEKQEAKTVTVEYNGVFAADEALRREAYHLLS